MARLIIVNLLFALGLAALLVGGLTDNRLWLGFIIAWCIAEALLARDQTITWWQWSLLFLVLGMLDLAIVLTLKG